MDYVFERTAFEFVFFKGGVTHIGNVLLHELMDEFLAVFSVRWCYGSAVFPILESCPAVPPK